MLRRVIIKSLLARKRHLLVASGSVLLGATLIASLVTLSLGMKTQGGREVESYGANLILLPESMSLPAGAGGLAFGNIVSEGYIAEEYLSLLDAGQTKEVKSYTPYLYTVATYQDQKMVLAGTLFDRLREMSPYWGIEGKWPGDGKDAEGIVIGRKVALEPAAWVWYHQHRRVLGTQRFRSSYCAAEVGGSEDNQVFIELRTSQLLSGRSGQV